MPGDVDTWAHFLNPLNALERETGNRERETVHGIILKMKAVPDHALSCRLTTFQQHPYVPKFRQDE